MTAHLRTRTQFAGRPMSERQNGRRAIGAERFAQRGRRLSTHDIVARNDLAVAAFAWSLCGGQAPRQTLARAIGAYCRARY